MAFYGIYDLAKKAGFTEGETVGYRSGHDSGFQAGRENGYAEWYQARYDEGYENGFNTGYENGRENGFEAGRIYMLIHGYPVMDPTYADMHEFLERDKTDEREYVENEYVCRNFAADVCNKAEAENIRCAFVLVSFPERSHALVAFRTVDEGLVFIEPQSDEVFEVEIGEPYWPRDKYEPEYDDTVTDILIVW